MAGELAAARPIPLGPRTRLPSQTKEPRRKDFSSLPPAAPLALPFLLLGSLSNAMSGGVMHSEAKTRRTAANADSDSRVCAAVKGLRWMQRARPGQERHICFSLHFFYVQL